MGLHLLWTFWWKQADGFKFESNIKNRILLSALCPWDDNKSTGWMGKFMSVRIEQDIGYWKYRAGQAPATIKDISLRTYNTRGELFPFSIVTRSAPSCYMGIYKYISETVSYIIVNHVQGGGGSTSPFFILLNAILRSVITHNSRFYYWILRQRIVFKSFMRIRISPLLQQTVGRLS